MVGFFTSVQKKLSKTFGIKRTGSAKNSQVSREDEDIMDTDLTSLLSSLTDDGIVDEADPYGVRSAEISDDEILALTLPHPQDFEIETFEAEAAHLSQCLVNAREFEMTEAEAVKLEHNLKNAYYETFSSMTELYDCRGDHQVEVHGSPTDSGIGLNDKIQQCEAVAECLFDFDAVMAELKHEEMSRLDDQTTAELVEEPGKWDFGSQEVAVWSSIR